MDVGLEERIVELILDNNSIRISDIASELDVTSRTIEREMKNLNEPFVSNLPKRILHVFFSKEEVQRKNLRNVSLLCIMREKMVKGGR